MDLRTAPNRFLFYAFLKRFEKCLVVSEDVGTTAKNRVTLAPFYWQSAAF